MNLFIETPQRAAERMARERERQLEELRALSAQQTRTDARPACDRLDAAPAFEQPDVAFAGGDEYWAERREDRRRRRTGAALRIVRALLYVLLVPLALALVFVVAYALTCIMNGASPAELADLLGVMAERLQAFAAELLA